jgi:hypothetical protein
MDNSLGHTSSAINLYKENPVDTSIETAVNDINMDYIQGKNHPEYNISDYIFYCTGIVITPVATTPNLVS